MVFHARFVTPGARRIVYAITVEAMQFLEQLLASQSTLFNVLCPQNHLVILPEFLAPPRVSCSFTVLATIAPYRRLCHVQGAHRGFRLQCSAI